MPPSRVVAAGYSMNSQTERRCRTARRPARIRLPARCRQCPTPDRGGAADPAACSQKAVLLQRSPRASVVRLGDHGFWTPPRCQPSTDQVFAATRSGSFRSSSARGSPTSAARCFRWRLAPRRRCCAPCRWCERFGPGRGETATSAERLYRMLGGAAALSESARHGASLRASGGVGKVSTSLRASLQRLNSNIQCTNSANRAGDRRRSLRGWRQTRRRAAR